jgi:hypothetical protein
LYQILPSSPHWFVVLWPSSLHHLSLWAISIAPTLAFSSFNFLSVPLNSWNFGWWTWQYLDGFQFVPNISVSCSSREPIYILRSNETGYLRRNGLRWPDLSVTHGQTCPISMPFSGNWLRGKIG